MEEDNKKDEFENLYEVVKTVRFGLKPSIETKKSIEHDQIFQIKDKIDWVDDLLFYSKAKDPEYSRKNGEAKLSNLIERCESQINNLATISINLKNQNYITYKIGVSDSIYVKKFNPDLFYKMKNKVKWNYSYPDPSKPKNNIKESVEFLKTKNQISISQLDAFPNLGDKIKFSSLMIESFNNVILNFNEANQSLKRFVFEIEMENRQEKGVVAGLHSKEERIAKIKTVLGLTLKVNHYLANLFQFKLNTAQEKEIKQGKKSDFDMQKKFYLENIELYNGIQKVIDILNFYTNNEKRNPIRRWSLNALACKPRVQSSGLDDKNEQEVYAEIFKKETQLENLRQRQSELKILKSQIKKSIERTLCDIEKNIIEDKPNIIKLNNSISEDKIRSIENNLQSVYTFIEEKFGFKLTNYYRNDLDIEFRHILDCLYFKPDLEIKNFALAYYVSEIGYFDICNEIEQNRKEILPENMQGLASKLNQLRKDLENVRITHFGRIIQQESKYFLALEKLSSDNTLNDLSLSNLSSSSVNNAKIIQYDSMTFKALRKLCIDSDGSIDSDKLKEGGKDKISKVTREPIKVITDLWGKYIQSIQNSSDFLDSDFQKFKKCLTDIFSNNSKVFGIYEFDISKCKSMKDLIASINETGYKIKFKDIDFEKVKELDGDSKIELYQIYNKDFAVDECFATTENDKLKLEKQKNKTKNDKYKPNLFTIYWNNLFEKISSSNNVDETNKKVRINPEGKFYIKLATEDPKDQEKIFAENSSTENQNIITKQRKTENKIYGDFQLLFNPVRSTQANKNIVRDAQKSKDSVVRIGDFNTYLKENISKDQKVIIGLDRGENSLVSYSICRLIKRKIEGGDIKIRFDDKVDTDGWVLDEIIETGDLSCVKVFNQNGGWKKSLFTNQKPDEYFMNSEIEGTEIKYSLNNEKNAQNRKLEIQKGDQTSKIIILPIRNNQGVKSGAFALKYESWKDIDGINYNYRVKQEMLKEYRLEQTEDLNEEMDLLNTQEFKNGFVSELVGFLAQRVADHNALLSFENLNNASKCHNLKKTCGASVYQIIENKIMQKLSYCVLKPTPSNHSQTVPKINQIDELKEKEKGNEEKDYSLGVVQITNEESTSKICPNCGFSKLRKKECKLDDSTLTLLTKTDDEMEKNKCDFGIDLNKKKEFAITSETVAYIYSNDGVTSACYNTNDVNFAKVISDPRQNETKSKDFIRCVHCGFDSRYPDKNHKKLKKITSGDELASYNIAKRGLELINSEGQ